MFEGHILILILLKNLNRIGLTGIMFFEWI